MEDSVDEPSTSLASENPNFELFPGFKDVAAYAQQTLGQLKGAVKSAQTLPTAGDDYDFYSSFDSFRDFCDEQGANTLHSINKLIRQHGVKSQLQPGGTTVSLDDKMDTIIETNDNILERVGTYLDEASGITKPKESILPAGSKPELMVASWNRKRKLGSGETEAKSFRMMHAKNVSRPQLKFKDKIDNSNTPFVPIIKYKPNARKPLNLDNSQTPQSKIDKHTPKALLDFIQQQRKGDATDSIDKTRIPHPYQFELDRLEPIPDQLQQTEPPAVKPLADTPLTLVDTVEELDKLSKELKGLTEFAVDLEHHSYRSFMGFTCLMQISTGSHDYIVDTLELRSDLHVLNESFTDPEIVKIFHGADMDIEWLQRDLGLYVVNMFDTSQASRVLGLVRHSLAYLLKLYCNVEADKEYQLADWRIRPLPEEMMKYAREDTHYLLFIYHQMKNHLLRKGNQQQNLLRNVLDRSRDICLKRYNKPIFTNESYMTLFRKNRKTFNKHQLEAFKLIYAWRDRVARDEDESPGYVLPNHMLFHISEELPREAHGVLACCTPIPPLLKQQVNEVHQLIVRAKHFHSLNKSQSTPSSKDVKTPTSAAKSKTGTFSVQVVNPLESLTLCPHDISVTQEARKEELGKPVPIATSSTLFGTPGIIRIPEVKMASPIITLFSSSEDTTTSEMTEAQRKAASIKASLANPFERYLPCAKPSQISSSILGADKISFGSPDGKKVATQAVPSNPMEVEWRLKEHTEPPKKKIPPPPPANPSPHRKWVKPDAASTSHEDEIPLDDDEEDVPLRQQGFNSKKRKPSHDSPMPGQPKKKEKRTEETPEVRPPGGPDFEAYDYSKANTQLFEGSLKQSKGKNKAQYYADLLENSQKKGPSKSKNHPSSGKRSVVYGQGGRKGGRGGGGGRGRGGKQHWPKR